MAGRGPLRASPDRPLLPSPLRPSLALVGGDPKGSRSAYPAARRQAVAAGFPSPWQGRGCGLRYLQAEVIMASRPQASHLPFLRFTVSLLLSGCLLLSASAGFGKSEDSAPGAVYVGTYEGVINPVTAEYFNRVLTDAQEAGATAVVLRLDTPGGLDTSMRLIIKDITASPIPVIVYVAPSGARAASAGVFILYSAHIAAMAPGTNVGAAHPVAMGGGEMDAVMKAKVENDAAAYIKSIAEKRGRNAQWAEDAVRKSVSVTEREALSLKVIDLIADDVPSLLAAVDGREVVTGAGKVVLRTKGARLKEIAMGW